MLRRLILAAVLAAVAALSQPASLAPVPAQTKTYRLPPDKLQKAIAYSDARNRAHFVGVGYNVLVLLVLLAWKTAPRFRDWAEIASPQLRIGQAYAFGVLIVLAVDILDLPMGMYEHRLAVFYQQSVQGWASWFRDWAMGEAVGCFLTGMLLWILYGVMRRSPRRWWFYFWLTSIPLVVFLMFVAPVLIDPLFNKFEPLQATEPTLVAQIERVVQRGGLEIPPSRMFQMNASEKVTTLNAYVSGIGASKRVVVWDTTMRKMNTAQILFVFGHEMGHYVLGHVYLLMAIMCGLILIFLSVSFYVLRAAIAKWGAAWSIRAVDDWASLPVLMLLMTAMSFLGEPVMSTIGRTLEHNADIYGLEAIHGIVPDEQQQAAQAFQILGEVSLSNPNPSPFIRFWLYDHPSVGERMEFAATYDPWSKGQAPKYVK